MFIYIAGSSSDMTRIRRWMATLQEFNAGELAVAAAPGIELTHDWVAVIEKRGEANPVATFHERASWAGDDLSGVREADLLWVLMPPGQSDGCFWEAGYADALGKEVVISGVNHERTIFTARGCCFEHDESAWDYIVDRYFCELDEKRAAR